MPIVKIFTEFNHQHGLPKYETDGAACMDVRANHTYFLRPGETTIIKTGMWVAVPDGYEMQVIPRSGLSAKTGLRVVNSPGCIDSDFVGEVGIIVQNTGENEFPINVGDRIAQIKVTEVPRIRWHQVDDVSKLGWTARGTGGFGSTGK